MTEEEIKPFVGKKVVIQTVDGSKTRAFLVSVGYQGVTLMKGGIDYTLRNSYIKAIEAQ